MHIKQAKAILIVGAPDSNVLEVIKELTGSTPDRADAQSFAGLTHEWTVETRYYSATIPIWVDEIADPEQWKAEFSKSEAKEVVEAIGAWLICFKTTHEQADIEATRSMFQAVQDIIDKHTESLNDSIMLAIGSSATARVELPADARGLWEDHATDHGFEFVDFAAIGQNEYGEKQGMARVKEALAAHEWTLPMDMDNADNDDDEFDLNADDVDTSDDLAAGLNGLGGSTLGMRTALMSDQDVEPLQASESETIDESQASAVDDLGVMLEKLLAAKERIADLPEQQRKQAAARAVQQLMKDGFQ